jgi:TPR repeat protein
MKINKNYQQVFELATHGDAQAEYELALMYDLGLNVDKNLPLAFEWYQKSANQEYAKAQYNLGIFYALAKSIDKDIDKSKYWIRKAIDNGYSGGSIF